MSFTLSEIVPWGRSYDEYLAMFSLSPEDLRRKIVGCSDGPASFNSVLTAKGGSVISVDPVYAFSTGELQQRIAETCDTVLEQTRKNKDEFVWKHIASVEELGRIRMAAMEEFVEDFDQGKAQGRYVNGSLPQLNFADNSFDLALCSHFLFLYSEQLSAAFHLAAIKELCRVAAEVRIFPLLELGSKTSRHLEIVMSKLKQENYLVKIEKTAYEFQKGGNRMLVVKTSNLNIVSMENEI
ncbi:MAG: class I SAM-dependent methyltransferase [Candidatus Electrothrix sp. AR4]|nr:class I SAM-dependent methyltransferase [Candidatus Electrothrix sp. AR4]